jgi:hypothetical protein
MDDATRKETSDQLNEPLLGFVPTLDHDNIGRIIPVELDGEEEEEEVAVGSSFSPNLSWMAYEQDPLQQHTDQTTVPHTGLQFPTGLNEDPDERLHTYSRYHHHHQQQQQQQQQQDATKLSPWRDAIWAVVFLLQIVILISLGLIWGTQSVITNDSTSSSTWIPHNSKFVSHFIILLVIIFFFATILSSMALMIMARWSDTLIQGSILFNVMVTLLLAILCAVQQQVTGLLFFLISTLVGLFYAWSVWSMIPWAASNLSTAVMAVSHNLGIYVVGLGTSLLTVLFTLIWLMAVIGTEWHTTSCSTDGVCDHHGFGFILSLFALSLFWTVQVLKVRLRFV